MNILCADAHRVCVHSGGQLRRGTLGRRAQKTAHRGQALARNIHGGSQYGGHRSAHSREVSGDWRMNKHSSTFCLQGGGSPLASTNREDQSARYKHPHSTRLGRTTPEVILHVESLSSMCFFGAIDVSVSCVGAGMQRTGRRLCFMLGLVLLRPPSARSHHLGTRRTTSAPPAETHRDGTSMEGGALDPTDLPDALRLHFSPNKGTTVRSCGEVHISLGSRPDA